MQPKARLILDCESTIESATPQCPFSCSGTEGVGTSAQALKADLMVAQRQHFKRHWAPGISVPNPRFLPNRHIMRWHPALLIFLQAFVLTSALPQGNENPQPTSSGCLFSCPQTDQQGYKFTRVTGAISPNGVYSLFDCVCVKQGC